ncbi:hypothetical protein MYX78_09400, partial [Acidobacteria bacterium AH-259-G07]|nr:hypothetical protein [Acidobacteria bacterium AH-259-G07]
ILTTTTLGFLSIVVLRTDQELRKLFSAIARFDLLTTLQEFLDGLRRGLNVILGEQGFHYIWYLIAGYYSTLTTVVLLLRPAGLLEMPIRGDSWLIVLIFHMWVGSNVVGDAISFNVSRRIINNVCDDDNLDWLRLLKSGIKDLGVASACFAGVAIVSNVCHTIQVGDATSIRAVLVHALDWSVLFRPYSIRVGGEEVGTQSWALFIVTASTYGPTVIFATTLLIAFLVSPFFRLAALVSTRTRNQLAAGQITRGDLMMALGTIIALFSLIVVIYC